MSIGQVAEASAGAEDGSQAQGGQIVARRRS